MVKNKQSKAVPVLKFDVLLTNSSTLTSSLNGPCPCPKSLTTHYIVHCIGSSPFGSAVQIYTYTMLVNFSIKLSYIYKELQKCWYSLSLLLALTCCFPVYKYKVLCGCEWVSDFGHSHGLCGAITYNIQVHIMVRTYKNYFKIHCFLFHPLFHYSNQCHQNEAVLKCL